jgi:hypothetical protein
MECGLIELVRWECNPTIAYACPGCGAARSGAPLIRDRHGLERSTQVGFTRLAHIGRRSRVNPRSVSAEKQEKTGSGPTSAALAAVLWKPHPEEAQNQGPSPVVPARGTPRRSRRGDPVAGTHDHRSVFMGPGSRYARPGRRKHQPAAAENDDRRRSSVSRLFFTGNRATATCRVVQPDSGRPTLVAQPNRNVESPAGVRECRAVEARRPEHRGGIVREAVALLGFAEQAGLHLRNSGSAILT